MADLRSKCNYQVSQGAYGSRLIIETGLVEMSAAAETEILLNLMRDYQLVKIPQTSAVVLKSLDGTTPVPETISPPTMIGQTFECVKVKAVITPYAPVQVGGSYDGKAVGSYEIVWQEVGAYV